MTSYATEATVGRARVEWASVPRVNLLPPEIVEGRRFRRVQGLLAVAVGATVVVGGLLTVWAQHDVSVAEDELAVVAARTAELQQQEAQYAEVPRVLAMVDAAKAARETAMAKDVLWYRFLDELAVATPPAVWLGSLNLTVPDAVASAAPDALTAPGIGEISVTGTAAAFPDVATWLTSVATVHGMDISRLQSAAVKEGETGPAKLTFSSTMTVTDTALSHRYDRKAG